MWLLTALLACTPTGTLEYENGDGRGLDDVTGDDGGDDDGGSDDGGSDDGDGGGSDDGGSDDSDYPLSWSGVREVYFPAGCEDKIFEEGVEITNESSAEDLLEACPGCDEVYEIQAGPDAICSNQVSVASVIYRGLSWDGAQVEVTLLAEDDRGEWYAEVLARGEAQDNKVYYNYDGEWYDYDYEVDGYFTLE